MDVFRSQIKPEVSGWTGLVTFIAELNYVMFDLNDCRHPESYICIIHNIHAAIHHFDLHSNMHALQTRAQADLKPKINKSYCYIPRLSLNKTRTVIG